MFGQSDTTQTKTWGTADTVALIERMIDKAAQVYTASIEAKNKGEYARAERLQAEAERIRQRADQLKKSSPKEDFLTGEIIPGIPNSMLMLSAIGFILFMFFAKK